MMGENASIIDSSESDSMGSEVISAESLIAEEWEPPYKSIKDYLEHFFNVEDLRGFCQTYFGELYRRLDQTDGFDIIIRKLIDHCEQKAGMEVLWQRLRQARPNHSSYDLYYQRWRKSTLQGTAEFREYAWERSSVAAQAAGSPTSNPLEKSEPEFSRWFFGQLTGDEQGLLLAASLFEGMSRTKLLDVAGELKTLLEAE